MGNAPGAVNVSGPYVKEDAVRTREAPARKLKRRTMRWDPTIFGAVCGAEYGDDGDGTGRRPLYKRSALMVALDSENYGNMDDGTTSVLKRCPWHT